MDSNQLNQFSAAQLAKLIATKALSPVELTEAYLDRIDRYDSQLHSYITVCRDECLADARKAEQAVTAGDKLGPLHGLPMALKDQYETKGILTTGGSRSLGSYVPEFDATTVARMKQAGAILLGKLNMTQFASGMPDPYQYHDPPRNPWGQERDPLGSSTGSGIALAASMCSISLGEDTGGSIRCPSSANGVVGLRPTWGRVSRHGILPLCWSMDTGGPMSRTVEDTAIIMNIIAGYDSKDPLTSRLPVPDYTKAISADLSGVRAGILRELTDPPNADQEVSKVVRAAAVQLEELGAIVEEVSFPLLPQIGGVSVPIVGGDAAYLHLDKVRKRPDDYGLSLRLRTITESLVPNQILQKSMRIRTVVRQEWLKLFERFDVLLSPTLMYQVGKIKYSHHIKSREEAKSRFGQGSGDATITSAFTGTPALSIPCGFDSNKMPIGLQIMGSHFHEEMVLKVGHAYERSTNWHTMRPSL